MGKIKLIAREGYVLTDIHRTIFATELELGIGDSVSNYTEIFIEEAETIKMNQYGTDNNN